MGVQKEYTVEKRRRKVMTRPILVRSEKPGQVPSVSYSKENTSSFAAIWKQ
jgi:hypothetical protein